MLSSGSPSPVSLIQGGLHQGAMRVTPCLPPQTRSVSRATSRRAGKRGSEEGNSESGTHGRKSRWYGEFCQFQYRQGEGGQKTPVRYGVLRQASTISGESGLEFQIALNQPLQQDVFNVASRVENGIDLNHAIVNGVDKPVRGEYELSPFRNPQTLEFGNHASTPWKIAEQISLPAGLIQKALSCTYRRPLDVVRDCD